jgi:hypothetical protein|tara:strand:- start:63 stop:320 length:258 start_codon:yes stop_codon:yes gene_type:complete
MKKGYVLGRDCPQCRDLSNKNHGVAYLYEDTDDYFPSQYRVNMKDHKPKLKLFFSRQEAKRYIQEELGMTENEIMIIPRCEVTDE